MANQSAYTPYHLADLLKYKGSYVGNNSAVGSILSMLPGHDYMASFSLETEQKPYGIAVNYQPKQSVSSNYSDFCNRNVPMSFWNEMPPYCFHLYRMLML